MRQVWDTITQFHMLEKGDRVLIGVSGGPDSVALLHLLHSKAEQYGIHLHVVHVNHMLRPEADTEADYVEALALQYGLPFCSYTVDVNGYAKQHGMSLEQAGHIVRFQCFRDAKEKWKINKLALGHHRNDRAESVLMHIIQGCGLDGLTAMPPMDVWDVTDQSYLIRPLSRVSKEEVIAYCNSHNLQYYVDATNLETDCLRNQMRIELLPQLEQYNRQIVDALVRLQDSCSADLDYITAQVKHIWEQHAVISDDAVQFPCDVFCAQHVAIKRRLLRNMYQEWTGSVANLSFGQIEEMRKIAQQSAGTQAVSLSGGCIFLRQYNLLKVTAKKQTEAEHNDVYIWDIDREPEVKIWNGVLSVTMDILQEEIEQDQHKKNIYADADKLAQQLVIRTRKSGDCIAFSNMQKHKSIKNYFIDKKIPKAERDTIPLVVSDDTIIWIPGYYIAESIKVTEHTKRICKLCFFGV